MTKLEIALPDDVQEIKTYQIVNGMLVITYEQKPKRPTKLEDVSRIPFADEMIEATSTLVQLIKIRNIWNGDWRPDWNDENKSVDILLLEGDVWSTWSAFAHRRLFYFKDKKTAKDFLKTFQADLDKIKILFQ